MFTGFDLETTGTSLTKDKIVQISIVHFSFDFKIKGKYKKLINPGIPIPKEATEIHGITDEMVKDAPKFEDVKVEILDELKQEGFVFGYNSNRFDVPFLHGEYYRSGVDLDLSEFNFIDVFKLYSELFPRTLNGVFKQFFGKDIECAHDAEVDVIATGMVLDKLLENDLLHDMDLRDVIDFQNKGQKLLDFEGKFKYGNEGEIVFAFGKNENLPVKSDPSYLRWMLGGDFSFHVKSLVKEFLKNT